ncbi:MAG: ATP-binding protein [Pseudomonadota bacterium]
MTFALSLLPALVAMSQGYSRTQQVAIATFALLLAAIFYRRAPRLAAIAPVAYFFSFGTVLLFDNAFSAPAAVLCLALGMSLLAVFWGLRGLVAGVLVTAAIMLFAGIHLFVGDDAGVRTLDLHLYEWSESNFTRASLITLSLIAALGSTIAIIVTRQERVLAMLKRENDERLEAERAFQQAQRSAMVAQVTSGLAHNFGNALTVITSWAELLDRHPDDAELSRRGIQDVRKAAKQASGVAQQIMALGKDRIREPETVNLSNEVVSQIRLLRTVLPSAIGIRENIQPDLFVLSDRTELQQGLLNLVLNARDAISDHGFIDIAAFLSEDDSVILEVKDNGEGMPDHVLARIFEPFFTTKGERGTGLGLATLQRSMQAANGEVSVDSLPGHGTVFRLQFPSISAIPIHEETHRHEFDEVPRKGRILVVDDEEMVRNVIALGLRNAGYDVQEARDVPSGILCLDDPGIELLLTDAVMPGGKLVDLVSAFRQQHPGKPIIVCSGYMPEDVLADLASDPEIEFAQKPMDLRALTEKVDAALTT